MNLGTLSWQREAVPEAAPQEITTLPRSEELEQVVHSSTHRRVRELAVICRGQTVIVRGRTASFYVKQLVTQAVRRAAPDVELDNEITVDDVS